MPASPLVPDASGGLAVPLLLALALLTLALLTLLLALLTLAVPEDPTELAVLVEPAMDTLLLLALAELVPAELALLKVPATALAEALEVALELALPGADAEPALVDCGSLHAGISARPRARRCARRGVGTKDQSICLSSGGTWLESYINQRRCGMAPATLRR
jgi:hypothetical protein